jgi:hypothetical protein
MFDPDRSTPWATNWGFKPELPLARAFSRQPLYGLMVFFLRKWLATIRLTDEFIGACRGDAIRTRKALEILKVRLADLVKADAFSSPQRSHRSRWKKNPPPSLPSNSSWQSLQVALKVCPIVSRLPAALRTKLAADPFPSRLPAALRTKLAADPFPSRSGQGSRCTSASWWFRQ